MRGTCALAQRLGYNTIDDEQNKGGCSVVGLHPTDILLADWENIYVVVFYQQKKEIGKRHMYPLFG